MNDATAFDLTDKVVLISGATGGIGRVLTPILVAAGAKVVLVSRHHDRLEDLAAQVGIPDTHCLLKDADLRDPAQTREMVADVIDCFGRIDVVLNLVGSWAPGKVADTSDDVWDEQLGSNLYTVFHVLREAVPHMTEGGVIVNAGNAEPVEGKGGQLAYAVAKGGVHTLTRSLALELKPRSIRVNAILPRNVDTPGNRALQPEADPSGWPSAEEVARVIMLLISSGAGVVSGALVPVYGGS
ncbi:MAG: SDR family oxidoreductase [Actinobacteria bacterium]|nr:SDR family oxidoreductase [Actinomycetota bacterium]